MPGPARKPRRLTFARVLLALLLLLAAGGAWFAWGIRPSNDRNWVPDQAHTLTATITGPRVVVHNVRNFDWTAGDIPSPRWEDRTLDLDRIESVWFVLTPFDTNWRGPAHAFLSFAFADSQYLAISIEARREVGETYSILKGMLKRFEIAYIAGDERDVIGLRVLQHHSEVYLYPVRATPEAVRELFTGMLQAANQLAAKPKFYGTLRDNCTTRILDHVNAIAPHTIPYSWRVLLPGYSDGLALSLNLIDTDLPLEDARQRFHVNDRVRRFIAAPDFSERIREPVATAPPDSTPPAARSTRTQLAAAVYN